MILTEDERKKLSLCLIDIEHKVQESPLDVDEIVELARRVEAAISLQDIKWLDDKNQITSD